MRLLIHDATVLNPPAGNSDTNSIAHVFTSGSRIERIIPSGDKPAQPDGAMFDASGLLLLPGIVDIHGDAFERQIQPRPETVFSHDIALADTDRQLIANGITTACHGLTFSWEGGLRGRDAALDMLRQVAMNRKMFHADHRIHLRFENHHVDGVHDALEWIENGWISLLAFNEHLPSIARKAERPEKLAAYAERARCGTDEFRRRILDAQSRTGKVEAGIQALAAVCRRYAIPMASHDDETRAERERFQKMEVTISEFPRTQEALSTALELGNRIIMGAPNVLLGGSHCGGLSAENSVRNESCHILASDYYYPSLLHAPFKLAFQYGACSLAQAWQLVSRNPADALGLRDRGRMADGCRADLLLVEASSSGNVRLVATIAAGRLVYCAEPSRLHASRLFPLAA
jgi:alpha-D-ribose 1-methylphosphonate 5-triphosphate diphosphatase